jgi:hypothetical protein
MVLTSVKQVTNIAEDEVDTFLRNNGSLSADYTALYCII